ncbi:four helix bundle protein [Patescibacteria group bacterium]|nr:MAG: four helix bundle protein [Patescibacteria group bacterium]
MKIERFEDILIWQKSKILVVNIYSTFKNCKDWSFRDQIQRAPVSIMNNIAEGFERRGDKEFKHFLFMAKGSAAEVRSMLYVASEIKLIPKEVFKGLYAKAEEISKMLSGFISKLNRP